MTRRASTFPMPYLNGMWNQGRRGLRGVTVILIGWLGAFGISGAQALQYQRIPLDAPAVLVLLRGPIIPGDLERFVNFLGAMPSTDRIMGLGLDSSGGNAFEAERIAGVIRRLDTSVVVGDGGECSSACFLLFASGSRRFVRPDALIGVHSASEDGAETRDSMAATTAIARDLAELGIPPAIIGKLVQTPPGRATWLTPSDLASMGVAVLDPASPNVPRRSSPLTPDPRPQYYGYSGSPPALRPPLPDPPPQSKAYQEGLGDRRSWEQWFAGLSGAFKEGAEYWAGQRSTPRPGSCYSAGGQSYGDWTAGCLAAKQFLSLTDLRRKSEADYRAGWNSF
jgi:hypothetical protein